MASADLKPTIVLVPGSFVGEVCYVDLIAGLRKAGYEVEFVPLLSVWEPKKQEKARSPAATVADDAAHIAGAVTKHVEAGKDVVLAMHSYSTIPGTDAAKGLGKSTRAASGQQGGVVRLVYLAGAVGRPGESIMESIAALKAESDPQEEAAKVTPPNPQLEGEYMSYPDYPAMARFCFNDVPEEQGIEWASRMGSHSAVSLGGKLEYPTYKDIPSTWALPLKDQVIPVPLQRRSINIFKEHKGDLEVVEISGWAHSFPTTSPDTAVAVIRKAAGENVSVSS